MVSLITSKGRRSHNSGIHLELQTRIGENAVVTEFGGPRTSDVAYFCLALLMALVAIASIWWVLDAPNTVDDRGTRATFAGWILGVLALVLSVAAASLVLRRQRARRTASGTSHSGDVYGGQQNISGHGTGNIGGIHFHGDRDRGDHP
jgi:hypothetical protein